MTAFDYVNKFGILKRDAFSVHDDDDLTIARIVGACVAKDIRRVEKLGAWLQWNGCVWKETDNAAPVLDGLADVIERHINDIRRRSKMEPTLFWGEFVAWKNLSENISDEDKAEKLDDVLKTERKIAVKLKNNGSRNAIMSIVGSHHKVNVDQLDTNTNKLVFLNGYYDCNTGKFQDNNRDDFATLCINTDYVTPSQSSRDNIREYLDNLGFDSETLEYLQRSFGYAATGQGKEKRFWWFRGEGDTSKSTLINMVAKCLDEYAATSPSDVWCDKRGPTSSGHTEDIARLRGKRLVVADEFQKKSRLNSPLIKKCTSGSGKMSASRKGEKTIEFDVMFALFCASNFDCQVDQDDLALINRLNTITFRKVISPEVKDNRFIDKFLSKDQNRIALLEWVLQGAHKYCKDGIGKDPEFVKNSQKEFMEDQISIADQIEDIVEADPKATGKNALSMNALMEAINILQKATRQHVQYTKREVGKAVFDRFGAKSSASNGVRGYQGLKLKKQVRDRLHYDPRIDHGYGADADNYEDLIPPN